MLRLDSSEMLQKGEETAQILKTCARHRHYGSPYSLYYGISMVGTGNDHVTAARCNRCASLIDILYARVKTVNHSKLHIRMVN